MAKTKTNSNSITAILINKLNYKKSGFRFAMLEKWNLPNDTIFTDCTHSTINCIEMGNKEVDIVGISNSKYVILIEIKANLSENMQCYKYSSYSDYVNNSGGITDIDFLLDMLDENISAYLE